MAIPPAQLEPVGTDADASVTMAARVDAESRGHRVINRFKSEGYPAPAPDSAPRTLRFRCFAGKLRDSSNPVAPIQLSMHALALFRCVSPVLEISGFTLFRPELVRCPARQNPQVLHRIRVGFLSN